MWAVFLVTEMQEKNWIFFIFFPEKLFFFLKKFLIFFYFFQKNFLLFDFFLEKNFHFFIFFRNFFSENSSKNYLIRLFWCSEKDAPSRGQMHTVSGERLFSVSAALNSITDRYRVKCCRNGNTYFFFRTVKYWGILYHAPRLEV